MRGRRPEVSAPTASHQCGHGCPYDGCVDERTAAALDVNYANLALGHDVIDRRWTNAGA